MKLLLMLAVVLCAIGCRTYVIAPGAIVEAGAILHVTTYSEKSVETPVQVTGGKLK